MIRRAGTRKSLGATSTAGFAAKARVAVATVVSVLLCAADASVPVPDAVPQVEELAPVVDWVLKTGATTVVRANITRAAGLGDSDVAVRERGFYVRGRQHTDVFAVATDRSDVVIIARVDESDGSAIAWRTSKSGKLEATVLFVPPAEPIRVWPSAEQKADFELAKRYFAGMMRIKSAPPQPIP